jgi:quercetin dioxygenase-like cupin family protein
MNRKRNFLLVLLCALSLASSASALAQGSGIKRTLVQKADVSIENREAVIARVEIDPGVLAGKHTHPGDEISYVLEGEGELYVEGEPVRKVKAGDGFVIPAGKVHDAKNTGAIPLKVVGVYVVEKGKPLASPAK